MQLIAKKQGDVMLPGGTVKAVFPGQTYELPDDTDLADLFEKAERPVEDKAVRPAEDKATPSPRGRRSQ